MNAYLWIYVGVIALGAFTAIVARREERYSWAIGVGLASILLPPIGAVLTFAYWTQIRPRARAADEN